MEQKMKNFLEMSADDRDALIEKIASLIKEDGTRKARGVYNGSPRMKGNITLGQTYAASLDQTYVKMFWVLNASKNHIVVGADASNDLAETPPVSHIAEINGSRSYTRRLCSQGT